jgi:hypothetical protein
MGDLNHLTWLPAQEKGFTAFFCQESFKTHRFVVVCVNETFRESEQV